MITMIMMMMILLSGKMVIKKAQKAQIKREIT